MSEIESLKQHYKKILDLISLIFSSLTVDIFQEKKEEDVLKLLEEQTTEEEKCLIEKGLQQ